MLFSNSLVNRAIFANKDNAGLLAVVCNGLAVRGENVSLFSDCYLICDLS